MAIAFKEAVCCLGLRPEDKLGNKYILNAEVTVLGALSLIEPEQSSNEHTRSQTPGATAEGEGGVYLMKNNRVEVETPIGEVVGDKEIKGYPPVIHLFPVTRIFRLVMGRMS